MRSYKFNDLPITDKKKNELNDLILKHLKYVPGVGIGVVFQEGIYIHTAGTTVKNGDTQIGENTIFYLSSLTKVFTSILVMRLVEKGILSLKDKVLDVLDGFQFRTRSKEDCLITVEDLLANLSGLYGVYPSFLKGSKMSLRQHVYEEISQIRRMPSAEHKNFYYSSANYNLVGYICEKVTGKSFDNLMKLYVIEPLGLENTGYQYISDEYYTNLAKGHIVSFHSFSTLPPVMDDFRFHPSTQLLSSIADCSKMAYTLCTGNDLENITFLSEESLSHMFERHSTVYSERGEHYGLGMSLKGIDDNIALHEGIGLGYYSKIYIKRSDRLAIVFLSNSQLYGCTSRLTHFLVNELGKEKSFLPRKIYRYDLDALELGWYIANDGFSFKVYFYKKGDTIFLDYYNMGNMIEEKAVPLKWDEYREYYYVLVFSERKKVGFCRRKNGTLVFIGNHCFLAASKSVSQNVSIYVGVYKGCLELDSSERELEFIDGEDGTLKADVDGKTMWLIPFAEEDNSFSSAIGYIEFKVKGNNVLGFTLNYVQFFEKI